MKKLIALSAIILTSAAMAFAETERGPAAVLQEIVAKLKNAGDIPAMLDYVDWPTAFDDLPSFIKERSGFSSPSDYNAQQRFVFSDPAGYIEQQFGPASAHAPSEEERTKIEEAKHGLVEQVTKMKGRLVRADYAIGAESIEAQRATVVLKITSGTNMVEEVVPFVKKDNQWRLARPLDLAAVAKNNETKQEDKLVVLPDK